MVVLAGIRRQHAVPDRAAVDRMRHIVLNASQHGKSRSGPAWRRPWRIAIPVAVTAVVVAVLLGAGSLFADGPGRTPSPAIGARAGTSATGRAAIGDAADAKLVMTLAAQTVQTEPSLNAGPGQYVYRQTRSVSLGQYTFQEGVVNVFEEQSHQAWLDPSKGLAVVRIISTNGLNRRAASAKDATLAAQVGFDLKAPPTTSDTDHPDPHGKGETTPAPTAPSLRYPTPQYLDGLPTDPAKLLEAIRREAKAEGNPKWSTDKTAFDMISDLVSWGDPLLKPQLRAALYRAVALMPGATRVPGQVDLAGRQGVAVGFAEGNTREEVIIDPSSLHPIGTRDVVLKATDGGPAGPISTTTFDFKIVKGSGETA
ncbi:CU044_5270 family protein [Dactylosporangium sp. NPDC049140]|uniref:CU044_5270 family protein n=1 Tax=Dactylosporangium sp. NPDC049140 TaxID=3155647 RepID=UPI0033FDE0DA